ncbi:MAG: hypothetical protein HYR96_08255 [Deltaproteobacteria bacterium]|nr:hypothetical protein [Deltaproteobacteria bacterium]MBI3293499.1 hypothetical protein [Deltaproteobacteria bacterium]
MKTLNVVVVLSLLAALSFAEDVKSHAKDDGAPQKETSDTTQKEPKVEKKALSVEEQTRLDQIVNTCVNEQGISKR